MGATTRRLCVVQVRNFLTFVLVMARCMRICGLRYLTMLMMLSAWLVTATGAWASEPTTLSWGAPSEIDPQPPAVLAGSPDLTGLSCPSVSLCVAIDARGDVVTSSQPAQRPEAWTLAHVDPQSNATGYLLDRLDSVSCPTSSLCVAVDTNGNAITSTDPTGGASAWTVAQVDPGGFPIGARVRPCRCVSSPTAPEM